MPRTNPSSATASPAASSLPELLAPGGLCAIHQPNFMPRLTTPAELFAADYWIVLDDVQFVRRDYQHRARLATLDGLGPNRWLTIPTHCPSGRATLIRDTLAADTGAKLKNLMVRAGHSSARAQLIYQLSKKRHQRKIASAMDADVRRQRQEAADQNERAGDLATVHRLVTRASAERPQEATEAAERQKR